MNLTNVLIGVALILLVGFAILAWAAVTKRRTERATKAPVPHGQMDEGYRFPGPHPGNPADNGRPKSDGGPGAPGKPK